MLFSLSRGSYAPPLLGSLSGRGSPLAAILTSGACILVAAAVSIFTPQRLRLPAGRGAVRRDPRVDDHPGQPPELSPPPRGRATCRCACRCSPGCSTLDLLMLAAILVTMGFDPQPVRVVGVRGAVADPDLGRLLHLARTRRRRARPAGRGRPGRMSGLRGSASALPGAGAQDLPQQRLLLRPRRQRARCDQRLHGRPAAGGRELGRVGHQERGGAQPPWLQVLRAQPDEIAVTASASAGLNALASALQFYRPRNKVIVSDFEFPTNAQIWHAQELRGARVVHVPRAPTATFRSSNFAQPDRRGDPARRRHPRVLPQRRASSTFPASCAWRTRTAREGAARLLPGGRRSHGRREAAGRRLSPSAGCSSTCSGRPASASCTCAARSSADADSRPTPAGSRRRTSSPWTSPPTGPRPPRAVSRPARPPVVNCYAAEAGLKIILEVGTDAIEQRVRDLTATLPGRAWQASAGPSVTPRAGRAARPDGLRPGARAGAPVRRADGAGHRDVVPRQQSARHAPLLQLGRRCRCASCTVLQQCRTRHHPHAK